MHYKNRRYLCGGKPQSKQQNEPDELQGPHGVMKCRSIWPNNSTKILKISRDSHPCSQKRKALALGTSTIKPDWNAILGASV